MKHDWKRFQEYFDFQERILRLYSQYMVTPRVYDQKKKITDRYYFIECKGIQLVTTSGKIVRVDLEKDVLVDNSHHDARRWRAKTMGYKYNVNWPNPDGRNIIRYCSPDLPVPLGPPPTGHHAYHHRHDFTTGTEVITYLGDDDWPHVGEFLVEIMTGF